MGVGRDEEGNGSVEKEENVEKRGGGRSVKEVRGKGKWKGEREVGGERRM